LPVQIGLYAAFIPPIACAVLGRSTVLSEARRNFAARS
jgi:hypothetical protein